MHQLNNYYKVLNKIPLVPSSIIRPTLSYLPWIDLVHACAWHTNGDT